MISVFRALTTKNPFCKKNFLDNSFLAKHTKVRIQGTILRETIVKTSTNYLIQYDLLINRVEQDQVLDTILFTDNFYSEFELLTIQVDYANTNLKRNVITRNS